MPAGVVIGAFVVRSLLRARRRTLAVGSVEVALFVTALCVAISQGVHDGPTPYSALPAGGGGPTGAEFPADHLERTYRLVALFADRDFGLLRWAPVFLLAFVGGWLLLRSRAAGLWRALPDLRVQERVVLMCATAVGAQVLMAAFVAPTMFGFWFPSRHLVAILPLAVPLVAIGLRRLPRIGAGLAALSVAATAWLWLDVLVGDGGLVEPRPDAPFGPLTSLLPRVRQGGLAIRACGRGRRRRGGPDPAGRARGQHGPCAPLVCARSCPPRSRRQSAASRCPPSGSACSRSTRARPRMPWPTRSRPATGTSTRPWCTATRRRRGAGSRARAWTATRSG